MFKAIRDQDGFNHFPMATSIWSSQTYRNVGLTTFNINYPFGRFVKASTKRTGHPVGHLHNPVPVQTDGLEVRHLSQFFTELQESSWDSAHNNKVTQMQESRMFHVTDVSPGASILNWSKDRGRVHLSLGS